MPGSTDSTGSTQLGLECESGRSLAASLGAMQGIKWVCRESYLVREGW